MEQLSVLQDVMREFFLPTIIEVFNNELDLYGEIEKTSKGIEGGKSIVIPLQLGYNERGIGARTEGETLPTAGQNEFDQATATVKYLYAVMKMTGQAMRMTKGTNTLINEMKRAMDGTLNAHKWDVNRQFWGNGSGVIATVTGVGSAPVISVSSAKYFRRGMYLDGYTTGGSSHLDSAYVTDVDYINNTIKLSSAGTLAATDYLVREDNVNYDSGFISRELMGLTGIISNASATFQGIDSTSNQWWKSIVHTAGGNRDITEMLLMAFLDDMVNIGGAVPTTLYTSLGVGRSIVDMLQDANQPIESMPTAAGFGKHLKYMYGGNEIPIIRSRFAPENAIYAINTKYLWLAEAAPMDWDDLGGGILKPNETTDTYWARLSWFVNLVCNDRQKFGYMDKLNTK